MKAKRKALVRLYRWDDLTRLVHRDMREKFDLPEDPSAEFHYIGGVDVRQNPFIRIDMTPLPGVPKFRP
jgi:hypothetical protein